jgi:hypothetical protein
MSDNRNRSAGARGVCSVDAGGLVTAPIRGQRRPGVPSLVLPGDPDGCGWFAIGGGEYVPFPSPPTGHPARERRTVRYVGRPTRWGNPTIVKRSSEGTGTLLTPRTPTSPMRHLAPTLKANVTHMKPPPMTMTSCLVTWMSSTWPDLLRH